MSSIHLQTELPGPLSRALAKRRDCAVPRGVYQTTSIFVKKTEGAILEDVDGNRLIDLGGGIGCQNAGHRPEGVVEAIHAQAEQYLHTCFMVTPYEPYVRLAEKLNELAPGPGNKKTALFNSGAEAVENGVKIARAYTNRPAIICFDHAFHGRTLLGLSLTSKTHPLKAGFGPFAPEVYRIPYASCFQCSYHLRYPDCDAHCARALADVFKRSVAEEMVAAVIVEPILGEGGFHVPPREFFVELQRICREKGILIIADEVQTGFARTGAFFASEHFGLEPDLLLTAKTLGGGLPLAGVTGRAEIMDYTPPGSLGGTFGGNPMACVAALATIETIEREHLCERARVLGERFRERALRWQANCNSILNVRGLGGMQAMEMKAGMAGNLSRYCLERGLIVLTTGTDANVIRLLMPLVITDEQFDEALQIMEAGLRQTAAWEETAAELEPGVVFR